MSESTPTPTWSLTQFLMDTNVAVDLMRWPEATQGRLHPSATSYLPVVVLGELFFGALRSQRVHANLASIQRLADTAIILDTDAVVARRYAELRLALARHGRPIPENDVWIAATALAHGLPVLTADAHFREVEGLTVVAW